MQNGMQMEMLYGRATFSFYVLFFFHFYVHIHGNVHVQATCPCSIDMQRGHAV
jgi:hypothetical protein